MKFSIALAILAVLSKSSDLTGQCKAGTYSSVTSLSLSPYPFKSAGTLQFSFTIQFKQDNYMSASVIALFADSSSNVFSSNYSPAPSSSQVSTYTYSGNFTIPTIAKVMAFSINDYFYIGTTYHNETLCQFQISSNANFIAIGISLGLSLFI